MGGCGGSVVARGLFRVQAIFSQYLPLRTSNPKPCRGGLKAQEAAKQQAQSRSWEGCEGCPEARSGCPKPKPYLGGLRGLGVLAGLGF